MTDWHNMFATESDLSEQRIERQREITAAGRYAAEMLRQLRVILHWSPEGKWPEAERLVAEVDRESKL